jgi:signal recognition particle receptor subunit beta
MAYSDASDLLPTAVKLLVSGGFGVGKTTFIGSVSEIEPLTTEELITEASVGIDSLEGVAGKSTTTVAFDFGRISLNPGLVLYLFGTPGQDRFWFMWDELSTGALGAVILADTRRLEACFAAVDFFERRGIKFVVAVNEFDGAFSYDPEEIRAALELKPHIPVALCDARDPRSAASVLVTLIRHLIAATMDDTSQLA